MTRKIKRNKKGPRPNLKRKSKDSRAIAIAKNLIDNILFQLEMGEFVVLEAVMNNPASSLNTYYPVPHYSIKASSKPQPQNSGCVAEIP